MFNPMDMLRELKTMNELLIQKLDEIIQRLDVLIEQGNNHG